MQTVPPPQEQSTDPGGQQFFSLSEIFIPYQLKHAKNYDHLILIAVHWSIDQESDGNPAPLKLIMPEPLRSSSRVTSTGLLINDISVATYHTFESLAVILFRFQRDSRLQRIIDGIENLVNSIDNTQSVTGVISLSHTILDRIELIVESPKSEILLSGKFTPADVTAFNKGIHYIAFANRNNQKAHQEKLWLRNRQLLVGEAIETAMPLVDKRYIVCRIGGKSDRQDIKRYIEDLRRKYTLKRSELNQEEESESYFSYLKKEREKRNLELVNSIYGHHKLLPAVTPIAIEGAADLAPILSLEEDMETKFQAVLKQLRSDFEYIYGVRLPGARIRINETDMPQGSYLIMINEIPLVMGTLQPDKRLCNGTVEALQQLSVEAESTYKPGSTEAYSWVAESDWEKVKAAGFTLWEPVEYVELHLAEVLKKNLREFVGFEGLFNSLELISAQLTERIQSAKGGIARFGNVLTALLEEALSIKPLPALAEAYLDHINAPAFEIAERLRWLDEINAQITDGVSEWQLFLLGEDFARRLRENIVHDQDNSVLALEPELTQDMLSAVRSEIGKVATQQVIVVEDWRIRPFLRKLTELEFPDVKIVARRELAKVDPDLPPPQTVITLED